MSAPQKPSKKIRLSCAVTAALLVIPSLGCESTREQPADYPPNESEAAYGPEGQSAEPTSPNQPREPSDTSAQQDPSLQQDPSPQQDPTAPGAIPPGSEQPQAGAAQPAPMAQEGQAPTEAEIEQFAQAYVEVTMAQAQFEQQAKAAQSTEDIQQLQQAAQQEMVRLIQKNGLTAQRFDAIGQATQQDAELRNQIDQKVQELQQSGDPQQAPDPQQIP